MGRKKLMKTEAEVAEQQKTYRLAHNKHRRDKYNTDSVYRQGVLDCSRDYAAKHKGQTDSAVAKQAHCELAMTNVRNFGQVREVFSSKSRKPIITLTSTEMAEAVAVSHVVVLHKWQRLGRFPRPEILARVGRTKANVYSVKQATAILKVMVGVYSRGALLRGTDEKTIAMLQKAMG